MKRSFIVRREDRVHGHRWVTVVRVDELPSDSIFFLLHGDQAHQLKVRAVEWF